jgi:tetratricopeptide (TPR) repeat protein
MQVVISDDPQTKYDNHGDLLDILPAKKLYVNVDSMQVMKNKVIDVKDTNRLVKRITWDLGGRNYILKNDLLVLDLIANNNWERPIYFAVTTGDEAYVGLKQYFQLEGLAYRFVPIKQTESEENQGGRVNTEVMYNNVMTKFLWGGMDKKGVNLDENCIRMTGNLRMQMGVLAGALISEGKNKKAKEILDKCLEKMPEENIPFDATLLATCGGYYEIGEMQKANALAKKLFDIYEGDIKIYNAQTGNRRYAYGRDLSQAKEILKRLTGMAQQFRQETVYKEFLSRISQVMSGDELNPPTAVPQTP